MPIVSIFFGIVVRMFYLEHGPAHVHAEYQGASAAFALDGTCIAGKLESKTAARLVRRWLSLHRDELNANWQRLRQRQPAQRVAPLE